MRHQDLAGRDAATVRAAIRAGRYRGRTAGLAPGRSRANLVVPPGADALDYLRFCPRNPMPCPVVGVTDTGDPRRATLGDVDPRVDPSSFRIHRDGRPGGDVTDVSDFFGRDLLGAAPGCSSTFGHAPVAAGIDLRHVAHDRKVPTFRTRPPLAAKAPFWTGTVPAETGPEVALTTRDQMNVGVGDVLPLRGDGVYDVATTVADHAVADAPELEGLDVPMIAMDAASAEAMVDAARPAAADIFADRFDAHVLAIAPCPPQVVFCDAEIGGLDDLEGLKARASGRMTAEFLEALGAEGVDVSFAEAPGAPRKGVVDRAVTGAGSGCSAGWWEVSTHLLPIPLGGRDGVATAVNKGKRNAPRPSGGTG